MTLTTDQDKQLWIVKTESWELPVYAQPVFGPAQEPYWLILPAMGFPYDVRMALMAALQSHSLVRDSDRWVVPGDLLEKIASKAIGVSPHFYYRAQGEPVAHSEFTIDDTEPPPEFNDDMIREVWARARIGQIGTFRAVWAALVNAIAQRLLIDRKSVDLGWFKIHALPYRQNWKHNLLARHPRLPSIMNNSAAQRLIAMNNFGISSDLSRTDMMATKTIKSRTVFQWSLEIETTKEWEDYQEKVELQRLTGGTGTSYINRWGSIVRESRKTVNALLIQFLKNMALSAGQPVASGAGGGQRIVPYIPEKGGRPIRVDRIDLPLVLDDRPTDVRGPEDAGNAFRKTKELPELPVLRFDYSDLRKPRGSVRDAGGEAPAGVHVLPSSGGEPSE